MSSRSLATRSAAVFPWCVWLAMTIATLWFVLEHGSRFPYADAVALVRRIAARELPSWAELWASHNDHRLVLPRLLLWGSVQLAGGDFRGPLALQVTLLSATAAGCIVLARRWRERASVWDALFPVLWLSWGNTFNLLSGWQLQMTTTSMLVIVAVNGLARSDRSRGAVVAAGLACVALPLCGGGGLPQAAILATFLAWSGVRAWRDDRVRATAAWVFSGLTVAVLAAYFVDFRRSEILAMPEPWTHMLQSALGLASFALGCHPNDSIWPLTGAIVLLVPVAGFSLLARSHPRDQVTWALGAGLAAQAALIGATVFARLDAEFYLRNWRYVSLLYPWVSFGYLAWARGRPRRRIAESLIAIATVLVFASSWIYAKNHSHNVRSRDRDMVMRLEYGAPSAEIALSIDDSFFGDRLGYARALSLMRAARSGPFAKVVWSPEIDHEELRHWAELDVQPVLVTPKEHLVGRRRAGREVIALRGSGRVDFAVTAQTTHLTGRVGTIVKKSAIAVAPTVEFTIDACFLDGSTIRLWSGRIEPSARIKQSQLAFDLDVPGHARRVEIRATPLGEKPASAVVAYWDSIRLD